MKKKILQFLWDLWCIISIVGIWPRFIEPRMIAISKKTIVLPNLPSSLEGLKILQFSDLHLSEKTSNRFLNKLILTIQRLNPDIAVFTGDFICNANIPSCGRLEKIFNAIKTPYGCFSVIGNHDYTHPIGINRDGNYDALVEKESEVLSGIKRLINRDRPSKKREVTEKAYLTPPHKDLIDTLKRTPTILLRNESKLIPIKDSFINICGLDEHTTGRADPEKAFKNFDSRYPGVVLVHNPDAVPNLINYPGDLILCGHTHGAQINLPWVWKKITLLENEQFKGGLVRYANKLVYINRGIGATFPFRWFSRPEVTLFTFKGESK